jgi:hypothetical protein
MSVHAFANLNAAETVASAGLGDEFQTADGAVYKYVQASAAIDAFSVCRITSANAIAETTITDLTTTRPGLVGIPQFAIASGSFAWVPVGPFTLREDGSTAFFVLSKIASPNVLVYGSATAGSVDDAVNNPVIGGLMLTASQAVDDVATACIATRRLTVN